MASVRLTSLPASCFRACASSANKALRPNSARSFSSRLPGINGVNGHAADNDASAAVVPQGEGLPLASAGGWYSPDSVERRLRKTRSRPASGVCRTAPQPSEEDFWLAAGAFDAVIDTGTRSASAAAAQAAAKPTGAVAAAIAAVKAAEDAAQWAPLPLTRVSTGGVNLGNLPAFIRTYELLVLPLYKRTPGCIGAQLLVGDLPPGTSRGSLLASAVGAGRGALVSVQSLTQWESAAALETAQSEDGYQQAMAQLQTLFQTPPVPSSWSPVAGFATGGSPSGATGAPQLQQPGPELGLR